MTMKRRTTRRRLAAIAMVVFAALAAFPASAGADVGGTAKEWAKEWTTTSVLADGKGFALTFHRTDAMGATTTAQCLFGVTAPLREPVRQIFVQGGVSCDFYAASIYVATGVIVNGYLTAVGNNTFYNYDQLFVESGRVNCGPLIPFQGYVYVHVVAPWGAIADGEGVGPVDTPAVCL